MTNYRYYEYVNGVEHYFEWQNATEGGIVFDMVEVRSGGGYRHTPMLAYDLNAIQSPSVQSMYFSYWGQQMGTVYRDTYYDVFGVHSNIAGDDTAFGYDVQLNYTTYGSDTAAMLHAIRDYFDSQSSQGQGTVTLDIPANGKTLTFTSQATGEVKSVLVSGNMTVDIRPS